MSLHILATGTLHKAPTTRTGSNGNEFTTCKVRVDTGEGETLWVNAICFDRTARETLEQLQAGDSVSVGGKAKIVIWEKDGKQGVGLDVTVSTVAASKARPRRFLQGQGRNTARSGTPQGNAGHSRGDCQADVPFNDEIPF
jgi:single-stranded DNA-binding protein